VIDPIHSLSFSIQANPGVYAVLIGSGISRAAQIPTGWEITLELIRKVALLRGEDCEPSPEEWHRKTFDSEPDYSELLGAVTKTQAERQQLLQAYFEINEEDREEGLKQPTKAHKAIASLVASGYIKVIITTNFDRLMERALEDVGVTPTIISSVDHILGAVPLIHTKCCLIKLHGDYKDTRILNTPSELAAYPDELDSYIDRVLDEFGLIVCGWSADWDVALRSAITRAPNRRFSTYWATRDKPGSSASILIQHRAAQVIQIEGADQFFQAIDEQVKSLEAFSRPHPLGTAASVASLKRYLTQDRYRIQFAELIGNEVERVVSETRGERFPLQGCPPPSKETLAPRIRGMEAACSTLISLAIVGGEWSEEPHFNYWERALVRLTSTPPPNGNTVWIDLQRYPAALYLYALGIPAAQTGRYTLIKRLITTKFRSWDGQFIPVIKVLSLYWFSERGQEAWQLLYENERRHAPLNDWVFTTLRPYMSHLFPDERAYELAFDKFELLLSLAYGIHGERDDNWVPPGSFGYRRSNREIVMSEIKESIEKNGSKSPFLSSGILGDSPSDADGAFAKLDNSLSHLHWY
jgi:hypothetical protein